MTVPVVANLVALQAAGNPLQLIVMYGAIFVIFYFVLLRPQQKQKKAHDELVKQLKKGDEIVTAGGIVGEVVHIAPRAADGAPAMDDRITIKSAESRLVIERGRIARVGTAAPAA
jgi:preprotein translocase subunit YajC